jgi:hypothetical protein
MSRKYSGWTVGTLKEHVEAILEQKDIRDRQQYDASQRALDAALLAADRAVLAALSAAKEAVIKAETATERRFDSVNEFRQTLSDQAATFMSRAEWATAHQALEKSILDLGKRIERSEGEAVGANARAASSRAATTIAIAVGVLLLTAISVGLTVYATTRG